MKRRRMLKAGGVALVAVSPLSLLFARSGRDSAPVSKLLRDPDSIVDLPPEFGYRLIDRAGDPMSDGFRVPARPDGMACFNGPAGTLVLMRNHENDRIPTLGPYAGRSAPAEAYDPHAYGGVTRVVLDGRTLERVSSNLVLTGTMRNCAGGPSPWGWLSCEENVDEGHGYVFRCRTDAEQLAKPDRITSYGRFNHEAVAIDPATNAAYLTEDRYDGCLYRFLPRSPQHPFTGRLQALRVVRGHGPELCALETPGQKLAVDWVNLPDGAPRDDSLRYRAEERGAARLRRGEGIWYADGQIFICSTAGGPAGAGQIFKLRPERGNNGASLELIAASPSDQVLDHPDNITVAPWGDVLMAEDGFSSSQYLRGLTPDGRIYDVARNASSATEFAGVCFSPDGATLFVNLQVDGLTLAITGPFERLSAA